MDVNTTGLRHATCPRCGGERLRLWTDLGVNGSGRVVEFFRLWRLNFPAVRAKGSDCRGEGSCIDSRKVPDVGREGSGCRGEGSRMKRQRVPAVHAKQACRR